MDSNRSDYFVCQHCCYFRKCGGIYGLCPSDDVAVLPFGISQMVRLRAYGIRQEVDGDMDGAYLVLLLFVPIAGIFAEIPSCHNEGVIMVSYLTAVVVMWITGKVLKLLKI